MNNSPSIFFLNIGFVSEISADIARCQVVLAAAGMNGLKKNRN